jgi:hypothetical protein
LRRIREGAFHPILFALYPVLALLAHNITQARPEEAVRAAVLSLAGVGVVWFFAWVMLRDGHRAALMATMFALLFFAYGHVYDGLRQAGGLGWSLGRHRYLIPIWIAAMALGVWWIARRLRSPVQWTSGLNIAAFVAVLIPATQVASFEVRLRNAQSQTNADLPAGCGVELADDTLPDVYYIILDAYTRADVLDQVYHFDNNAFIQALEARGFFVAPRSQSNYAITGLSLAAAFNMDYLAALDPAYAPGGEPDWAPLWPLLTRGVVRRTLECLDYSVVTFDSGYYWSGWRDADIFFDPLSTALTQLERSGGVNAFESVLIESSAARLVTDAATLLPDAVEQSFGNPYREHYARILYMLDALETSVPRLPGPKFVFAHVLIPHPPFIVNAQGDFIAQSRAFTLMDSDEEMAFEERARLYLGQIEYLNGRVEAIVDTILADADTPPVVIIQGDHGLDGPLASQMAILNAYYLQGAEIEDLYGTISPVNSFRVVFNHVFHGEFPYLEDRSYYSRHSAPFDLTEVQNPFTEK